MAVEAGIDLIQHPEVLSGRELPDDLVALIVERGVICSMLTNTLTGNVWREHLERRAAADQQQADSVQARTGHQGAADLRDRTTSEERRRRAARGEGLVSRRRNAEKLIAGGCTVTIGTDNYRNAAPEFAREPKPEHQDPGIGSIIAIEGLVELGMTPMEAIVAATRNGALAANLGKSLGTLTGGRLADLLVFDRNPLEDISNIRSLQVVMIGGRIVDRDRLPESPVYYREEH